jgi:Ca-activated chloride channel family protein
MRLSPITLCLAAVMAASAADSQPIRVDVNLVNVAFSVHNAHGKLRGDLSQDDFEVLEDGVPQRVSFFGRSPDVPLSLGLVADVSASQRSFSEGHRHDMKEFLKDVLAPRDQAFPVCFGNRMQLVGDFTASDKSLMDAFERFENGESRDPLGGGTALFDAVYFAVTAKLAAVAGGGRALILFSDGQNNDSAHNMLETIEAAQTADTRIFTMRYSRSRQRRPNVPGWSRSDAHRVAIGARRVAHDEYGISVMERLARDTGGRNSMPTRVMWAESSGKSRRNCRRRTNWLTSRPTRCGMVGFGGSPSGRDRLGSASARKPVTSPGRTGLLVPPGLYNSSQLMYSPTARSRRAGDLFSLRGFHEVISAPVIRPEMSRFSESQPRPMRSMRSGARAARRSSAVRSPDAWA